MLHLASTQYWDWPAGGNTGRLFLTFGGRVCTDRISNCPLDRVLTYKNLIYLLNLQLCTSNRCCINVFSSEIQTGLVRHCWSELFALGLSQCAESMNLPTILAAIVNHLQNSVQEGKEYYKTQLLRKNFCPRTKTLLNFSFGVFRCVMYVTLILTVICP